MDIQAHNEEEKAKLASAIQAIDAGDLESAKSIIQECIAGEDAETAEEVKEEQPSLKQKFQKAMQPKGEIAE